MTRRVVTAAVTAASPRVWGANEAIRIGLIGPGGRSQYVRPKAAGSSGTRIAAICGVNPAQMDQAKSAFALVAAAAADFRALLARFDVDGKIIGPPDHWHAPMMKAAVEAGKDV